MKQVKSFNLESEKYLSYRPIYPESFIASIAKKAPDQERVWDCGTGNGQAAIALAKYFKEVIATDINSNQIKQITPPQNLTFIETSVEDSQFSEGFFSTICVAQALHWFDFERFWPIVRHTLRKDGLFLAWGYSWFSVDDAVDQVVNREILDRLRPYWAPQNQLLWNGYNDIEPPLESIERYEVNTSYRWDLDRLLRYVETWSAAKLFAQENGRTCRELCLESMQKAWGHPAEIKPVNIKLNVVQGRR